MRNNQVNNEGSYQNRHDDRTSSGRYSKKLILAAGSGIVLLLTTVALAAATLGVVVANFKDTTTTSTVTTVATTDRTTMMTSGSIMSTTPILPLGSQLAQSIQIPEVMMHLNALQQLATASGGNRAINTLGFNRTLDYITNHLKMNTNFNVNTTYFYLKNFLIESNPILLTSINGTVMNRTFSTNLSEAEFIFMQFTKSANFSIYVELSSIPNVGCSDADWQSANPSPNGRVALVKRGVCAFVDKAELASKYNVAGLMIYNDGTASDRFQPVSINLGENNQLPALSLSYNLGQELANAAQDPSNNVGVRMIIDVANQLPYPVGNICADTPTGDATQTIVIGSHSDSVPAGPGINDNGWSR